MGEASLSVVACSADWPHFIAQRFLDFCKTNRLMVTAVRVAETPLMAFAAKGSLAHLPVVGHGSMTCQEELKVEMRTSIACLASRWIPLRRGSK